MEIRTEAISNWDDKVVKHKKLIYPQPGDPNTPRNFMVCLAVGSRGTGKSFAICKLLKQFERFGVYNADADEVDQRIILFSPTVDSNPIFRSLKYLGEDDIHASYSDDKLVTVIDDIKTERDETERYQADLAVWKKFLRARKDSDLTPEEYATLDRLGYEPPDMPKYPNGVVNHLIFDDLIASPAFKSTGKSALTNLVLRNRHLGCNILIAAQSLKSVPKPMRLNTSLFILYRFCNRKMVCDDIYSEISAIMTPDEFDRIYEFATRGDHDALVIDMTGTSKDLRVRKNFDEKIIMSGLGGQKLDRKLPA